MFDESVGTSNYYFFFKQKTAYEMRISDWSSDVCSSDLPANVKVTAYDFSIYGGLKGKVVRVSPDSIYDEVERQAYFTLVVETSDAFLVSNGKQLPITPGMLCDVEILTGKKSVLSYLLKIGRAHV